MKSVLLRSRDAGMIGPFCDYVTSTGSCEDSIRKLRVHAKTHHERGITDKEVSDLNKWLEEQPSRSSAA